MKYIFLDTSTKKLFAGVYEDYNLLSCIIIPTFKNINEKLVENFDFMLNNIDININEVDMFLVNVGPGSWTGVRIGVSFFQGVSLAVEKPCKGITSFDLFALSLKMDEVTVGLKLIGDSYGIKHYNFPSKTYSEYININKSKLNEYKNIVFLDDTFNPIYSLCDRNFIDFLCEPIPFYMMKSHAEINFDKKSSN